MTETTIQNAIRIALSAYGICVRLNTGYFKTDDGRTVKCGIPGMAESITYTRAQQQVMQILKGAQE